MPIRRSGAPRLIEWTGERCVPWTTDLQIVYEHYHRYLWAMPLVASRRVLDLGSGEGFGTALLADRASEIVGIDIDRTSVEHSRLNYPADNLDFRVASAVNLALFPQASFDAVVAFEVIEHIADQEQVLLEVARVLKPTGLLIMSTPDRLAYTEQAGNANPFHERELTQPEFARLLEGQFSSSALFTQRAVTGSHITALDEAVGDGYLPLRVERTDDGWVEAGPPEPMYLVAVASNAPLPDLPKRSTLADYELGVLREAQKATRQANDTLRDVEARASSDRAEFAAALAVRMAELEDERTRVSDARAELDRVHGSVTWQLFQRARSRWYGLIGHDSLAGRTFSAMLRRVGRLM